jgi:hypothetical protein
VWAWLWLDSNYSIDNKNVSCFVGLAEQETTEMGSPALLSSYQVGVRLKTLIKGIIRP